MGRISDLKTVPAPVSSTKIGELEIDAKIFASSETPSRLEFILALAQHAHLLPWICACTFSFESLCLRHLFRLVRRNPALNLATWRTVPLNAGSMFRS